MCSAGQIVENAHTGKGPRGLWLPSLDGASPGGGESGLAGAHTGNSPGGG